MIYFFLYFFPTKIPNIALSYKYHLMYCIIIATVPPTHENRRVLKTLLRCSVFPECQTAQQSFANLTSQHFPWQLSAYYSFGCYYLI